MSARTGISDDEKDVDADVDVENRIERLLATVDARIATQREFWGAQFDLGLAWPHFPAPHGGLGLDPRVAKTINQRLQSHGVVSPAVINPMGIGMAGPTIVAHGTPEQKHRFLRPCFTCEELWCQLFSEPSAGSDLANLSMSAQLDGDEWVVNGQKVWTSLAHAARWGLLLARTDSNAPKHKGLTYFIVDMQSDGVTVRPIRQLDGSVEFNEVFFDDVRIPDRLRIGSCGDGWRVALTTLMNERVLLSGSTGTPRGGGHIAAATGLWRSRGTRTSARRDELVRLWIRAEVARLTTQRAERNRDAGGPGPEGSIGKLANAELEQDIYEFCVDLLGADGMLRPEGSDVMNAYATADGSGDARASFLFSRHTTIAGGTSEIMRNILGERVLGLPGDVRVDRELPWNETLR